MVLAGVASALVVSDTQTWNERIQLNSLGGLEITETGHAIFNGRVDHDGVDVTIAAGGILETNDTYKLPDDAGPSNVYVNGTWNAHDIESFGQERDSMIYIGGDGVINLATGYGDSGTQGRYNPLHWLDEGSLVLDSSLDPAAWSIQITDMGGGAAQITAEALAALVSFDSEASGDLESVSPAVLTVVLTAAEEGQTYTVDYAVTGGTATSGVDYIITTAGPGCWNYPTQCHGDTDNDGEVKGSDFLALKASWYKCAPDADYNPCADFDRDGCVKGSDFLILKSNWYQTVEANCPSTGSPTLQFDPGQTSKTISIDIVDDGLDEEDETIIVELSNPTGPNVMPGRITEHTYTIIDMRPKVSFEAESSSGLEDATPAQIAVTLSHAGDQVITVDYTVTGGTATGGGVDYAVAAGTLHFDPGVLTQHVSIDIVDDEEQESTETIEIALSNPTNATLGQPTTHTYMILDNEQGTFFDGMVWYFSGDNAEGRFEVNADGQLEWKNLVPPDHVIVQLPEQRLSEPGDVAEVSYWYKGEGGDNIVSGDRGTGDIRTGLFDSNGSCHAAPPDLWYTHDCFIGYIGYRIGFSAHASGYGGHIAKRIYPFERSLLQSAEGPYGPNSGQKDINAFGLPRGQWALWTLRLERTSSSRVVFTVTCNGRTAQLVDNNAQHQPQKIDALGMYFANVRDYTLVSLATEQPTP